jgi:hypothetical protein
VRLAQASHHLAHYLARLLHSDRALELGPQLLVYTDPINAAEAGIPVLVADRGPNELEGFEIEALLFRGEPVLARLLANSDQGAAGDLRGAKRSTRERDAEDPVGGQSPILQGLWQSVREIRPTDDQSTGV